ncbi:MAG: hypothetical protein A2W00_13120 [Candidatus Eisenbacteria bacterium RBG_16_71_46]|nr:MAG: hypothetical protein A2W00_13120 [Candidatus Eisenbacteria bacterium RBG_16_71_46]
MGKPARKPDSMTVSCPHCSSRYLLPERLMGKAGAKVRCPQCRKAFVVRSPAPADEKASGAAPIEVPPPAEAKAAVIATDVSEPAEEQPAAREPLEAGTATHGRAAAGPEPPPGASPAEIARILLDDLNARSGEAMVQALARGHLFAEFGRDLVAVFEEYRRRAGPEAGSGPFREALRERWGVDLSPVADKD